MCPTDFALRVSIQSDPAISIELPQQTDCEKWLTTAMAHVEINHLLKACANFEINLKIVDIQEMTHINAQHRNKNQVTNVLSFSGYHGMSDTLITQMGYYPLGDIIICGNIVHQEAAQQNKPIINHWAHLCIHACLHLLGYDHNDPNNYSMETLEINILQKLGFSNPY